MNHLIGSKIKLEVHEPWDKSEILFGEVENIVQPASSIQLLVNLNNKSGTFIISERYLEENLLDISTKNKIHVAIGLYNSTGKSSIVGNDMSDHINNAVYYGIGSILLV